MCHRYNQVTHIPHISHTLFRHTTFLITWGQSRYHATCIATTLRTPASLTDGKTFLFSTSHALHSLTSAALCCTGCGRCCATPALQYHVQPSIASIPMPSPSYDCSNPGTVATALQLFKVCPCGVVYTHIQYCLQPHAHVHFFTFRLCNSAAAQQVAKATTITAHTHAEHQQRHKSDM